MTRPPEIRFSREQVLRLRRCSNEKDITLWNDWRSENPDVAVELAGADLQRFKLAPRDPADDGINLCSADLRGVNLANATLSRAHFEDSDLQESKFDDADLVRSKFDRANLEGSTFIKANCLDISLQTARCHGVSFRDADLRSADLQRCLCDRADFTGADLRFSKGQGSYQRGATFTATRLSGARFRQAVVDGETLFWECTYDQHSDFQGVGLASARVQPGLRAALEANVRRHLWEDWYSKHPFLKLPVFLFWWTSDYGCATLRVLGILFVLIFGFAFLYFSYPGLVENLAIGQTTGAPLFVRALYFSLVTMTTGFGQMHAAADSSLSHCLIMAQAILGYLLLGILITRFAIQFQSTETPPGGPLK